MSQPLVALTTAATGDHVLTLSVTPDNLGPVTVRAQVSAGGIHVELFAPNDAGRDALRAIMPELRRDLAGTGMNNNLQLSNQNQPSASASTPSNNQSSGGMGTGNGFGAGTGGGSQGGTTTRSSNGGALDTPQAEHPALETPSAQPGRHASSIDVMA